MCAKNRFEKNDVSVDNHRICHNQPPFLYYRLRTFEKDARIFCGSCNKNFTLVCWLTWWQIRKRKKNVSHPHAHRAYNPASQPISMQIHRTCALTFYIHARGVAFTLHHYYYTVVCVFLPFSPNVSVAARHHCRVVSFKFSSLWALNVRAVNIFFIFVVHTHKYFISFLQYTCAVYVCCFVLHTFHLRNL